VIFRRTMTEAGWLLKQVLIWVKHHFAIGRQDYHWQHEPILYGWKPGAAHRWHGGFTPTTIVDEARDPKELSKAELLEIVTAVYEHGTTVHRAKKPAASDDHPTAKPVRILVSLVENSTRRGELVLDTFAGSGSTLIACHQTGRRAALVELEPKYADVICRRYQEHTGIVPVLESTGKPHDFSR
jgi:DNA modification methylase